MAVAQVPQSSEGWWFASHPLSILEQDTEAKTVPYLMHRELVICCSECSAETYSCCIFRFEIDKVLK